MLVIFHGDDRESVLSAYLEFVSKKRGTLIDEGTNLVELSKKNSLFGESEVYALSDLATIEDLENLAISPNMFIARLEKLDSQVLGRLSGLGADVREFSFSARDRDGLARQEKAEATKIFRLTDSLLSRDRRNLWLEYHKLLGDGAEPEDLYWKLVWQTKNMLIAITAETPAGLNMHPFVFQKSKTGALRYGQNDLRRLSSELLYLWSDYINGKKELPLALEQFILSV